MNVIDKDITRVTMNASVAQPGNGCGHEWKTPTHAHKHRCWKMDGHVTQHECFCGVRS